MSDLTSSLGNLGDFSIPSGVGSEMPDVGAFAQEMLAKEPALDDTWFTKERMDAIQSAGDKASANMAKEAGALGKSQFQTIATPSLPQLQLATKAGGMTQPMQRFAHGGALSQRTGYSMGGSLMPVHMMKTMMDIKNSMGGAQPQNQGALQPGLQNGPGNGRSDSIYAKLADGGKVAVSKAEYVLPADVVSFWGGHSTEAGGKAMDAFVDMTRKMATSELGALPSPRK